MITCTDYAAWTGLFGGSFCGQLSVNGTLGVPAPGNMPGGRAPAAQWIDSNGNLWLFGGMGLDHAGELIGGLGVVDTVGSFIGPINDLWYYNPSTNLWTWMGGNTSTSGCIFDGLEGVHCGGQPGNYGTLQTPAGGNLPGTRSSAVSWTDKSGNLWLFSGWGQGNSFFSNVETYPMNDVWESAVHGHIAGNADAGFRYYSWNIRQRRPGDDLRCDAKRQHLLHDGRNHTVDSLDVIQWTGHDLVI
jgi:hypothetical protein